MDPYLTTGMLRTQSSAALIIVGPYPNQQNTADNGEVQSMRMMLAKLATPVTVSGF